MSIYKKILCAFIFILLTGNVLAQSSSENGNSPSTNSPYTRYGFGQLSDQSFGNSKAMGGVAYGLRDGSQINPANPASYTAIDSLTFLFDGGFSIQNTNFSEGKIKQNAKNSSFDYIAMQFRLHRRLALTLGFMPFSSVGYSISTEEKINGTPNPNLTAYSTYNGSGGLNQLFLGAGFKVFNGLSVGVNASYLFGTITHSSQVSFSDNSFNMSNKTNSIRVQDYKLDFGLQYTQKIGQKQNITLGAVYSLKHKLNNDSYKATQRGSISSSGSYIAQGANVEPVDGFEFPHCFGAGLTYVYDKRLTVGFDYTLQKWGDVKYFDKVGEELKDRSKYALGIEFLPSYTTRNYFAKIRYRVGAYYSDPYVKVRNGKGADEFGVSAGFGLPIFMNKSILNISAQYIKVKPQVSGLLEENYMKISIGLTFNERWFAKWKVQ